MSLFIKDRNTFQCMPIASRSRGDRWEVRSLDFIPQQAWESSYRAQIGISDHHFLYIAYTHLPGVEIKNLWVYIEGRILTLYAGITGEKQENGEYRYTEEPFGWVKGEIVLPEQIHQRPKTISFHVDGLFMRFMEKADVSS